MEIYTNKEVSPVGSVNKADLIKVLKYTAIFFAAPILMYFGQLQGSLAQNQILLFNDFIPNTTTIGAIQGWAIGIIINLFLKFRDGDK